MLRLLGFTPHCPPVSSFYPLLPSVLVGFWWGFLRALFHTVQTLSGIASGRSQGETRGGAEAKSMGDYSDVSSIGRVSGKGKQLFCVGTFSGQLGSGLVNSSIARDGQVPLSPQQIMDPTTPSPGVPIFCDYATS